MRIVLLSILLFAFINTHSQSKITIELIPDTVLKGLSYSNLKVIDARDFKNNIGYVTRGINHNGAEVLLPDTPENYLEQAINQLLPKENESSNLVLVIRNIQVSENLGYRIPYGYCNIEVEFAKQVDTLFYSLGKFNSNITERNNDIKGTHGERILHGLEECFKKFDSSDWKNNNGILIQDFNKRISYDYKNIPPKGIYLNYDQMARKSPLDVMDFEIKVVNESKNFTNYLIDFKNKINPEVVQFVSDGKSIYMRVNRTQFVKSGSYGKYIYFQGKIPIETSSDQTVYLVNISGLGAGALIGGLVGGLFFTALSGTSTTTTDNTVKSAVIDTEAGTLKLVTNNYLYRITKEFTGMLKEYRASKRKLADKEKVIIQLNSKY